MCMFMPVVLDYHIEWNFYRIRQLHAQLKISLTDTSSRPPPLNVSMTLLDDEAARPILVMAGTIRSIFVLVLVFG